MREVKFEVEAVERGGHLVNSMVCKCAKCGHQARIMTNKSKGALPHNVAKRKFVQQGWLINKRAVCPQCVADARAERIARSKAGPVEDGNVTPFGEKVLEAVVKKGVQRDPQVAVQAEGEEPAQPATTMETAMQQDESKTEAPQAPQAKTQEAKAMADASTISVKQMSPSDKRKVFRAVDDAWDEDKGRYAAGATDKTIAQKLDVPRRWVEDVRREAFGENGNNDEIEELGQAVSQVQGTLEKMLERRLDEAAEVEKLLGNVKMLDERLRKVEVSVGVKR